MSFGHSAGKPASGIPLYLLAEDAAAVRNASTGGVSGTVGDPKLIFSVALKGNACSIILAHNHPSGNLKPNNGDLEITHNISQAGKFLEISVNDHLIITSEGFYSFADEGLM